MVHRTGALATKDLERVVVDTTVQPKNVTFPTDVKLTHKAIVMLGRQGAGKGTQAIRLAQHYVVPHISTGDMLRGVVTAQTELGWQVKKLIDAGKLVPDTIIIGMMRANDPLLSLRRLSVFSIRFTHTSSPVSWLKVRRFSTETALADGSAPS